MTTSTLTLTDFLLARIAEDEAAAEKAGSFTPWDRDFQNDNYGHLTVQPSRVLATCKAHRAIVGLHSSGAPMCSWTHDSNDLHDDYICPTIRALASIYADHPDYRSEWAS